MSLKRAALLNAASRYAGALVQLALGMILARLLTPEEYGVVAIAMVFTTFFGMWSDMGFSTGIIQDKALTIQETDGIFTASFGLGLAVAIAFTLFSQWFAGFYGEEILKNVGVMLSASLFLSTLSMVPGALLSKHREFGLLAARNFIVPLVTGILAVLLAVAGLGCYALIWQNVVAELLMFLLNFRTAQQKYGLSFRPCFDFSGLVRIARFSLYQFAFSFCNYFARNLDSLLVGRYFGAAPLGYYDKAYKITGYPQAYLTGVVAPILQPILSEYQHEPQVIYEKALKPIKVLSLLGAFIVPFGFVAADDIILVLYGGQWGEAASYFRILALSIWGQMLCGLGGGIYQSAGNTRLLFWSSLPPIAMLVGGILLGITEGNLYAVARNVSFAYICAFFYNFYMIIRVCLQQDYLCFLWQFWPEAVMMGVLFFALEGLCAFTGDWAPIVRLGVGLLLGGGLYVFLCRLLGQWKYIRLIIK